MAPGYYSPIGGSSRLLAPTIAVQYAPFTRGVFAFGARSTAIKIPGPEQAIVIVGPFPFGQESKFLLKTLQPGSEAYNVKYLIAPDYVHHLGLKSWKTEFPNAKIIGMDGLPEKKISDGVSIDHVLKPTDGNKVISTSEEADLPGDLLSVLSFVYLPGHGNKEIVVFHKESKSLITADLMFNLPAYEQYSGSGVSPTGGWSFWFRAMGLGSWLQSFLIGKLFAGERSSNEKGLQAIYSWDFTRIILCHGDIVETDAKAKFYANFKKFLKEKSS